MSNQFNRVQVLTFLKELKESGESVAEVVQSSVVDRLANLGVTQIQEGMTMNIHKSIDDICELNKGVAVVIKAQHTCACLRGVMHDGCAMVTSKLSKDFMDDVKTRKEFYDFIRMAES